LKKVIFLSLSDILVQLILNAAVADCLQSFATHRSLAEVEKRVEVLLLVAFEDLGLVCG
jgi:hypothetical protein